MPFSQYFFKKRKTTISKSSGISAANQNINRLTTTPDNYFLTNTKTFSASGRATKELPSLRVIQEKRIESWYKLALFQVELYVCHYYSLKYFLCTAPVTAPERSVEITTLSPLILLTYKVFCFTHRGIFLPS